MRLFRRFTFVLFLCAVFVSARPAAAQDGMNMQSMENRVGFLSAGTSIERMDAVKTHNPFAVNDVLFSRQTGYPLEKMNNFGCSLVWGHPQAPMGTRGVIELIEELALRGGGYGLFSGCAAGDTAMAVVVEVADRRKN